MKIYSIDFYITKGCVEKIAQRLNHLPWIYGKDFDVLKIQQLPESLWKLKYVSAKVWTRNCKFDFLPWPYEPTIGLDKTDGLSFLSETKPEELPLKLYRSWYWYLFRINLWIATDDV